MAMEKDADKINDAERQIQQRLYTEAEKYAETRKQSKVLNKTRAESRAKVDEMGFRTDAYQVAIRIVKDLSASERTTFLRDLNTIVGVLGSRQKDLFPEEALKAAKREEQRKAEQKAERDKAKEAEAKTGDTNPRSDPKSGGAGKVVPIGKKAAPKGETPSVADVTKAEQAEGEAALQTPPGPTIN